MNGHEQVKQGLRESIDKTLGHSGVDGTYYYVLKRVKAAFRVGTMSLDDFHEVDESFTEELVEEIYMDVVGSMLNKKNNITQALQLLVDFLQDREKDNIAYKNAVAILRREESL